VHEIGSGKLVSYSPGEIKIWDGMQGQCLHTIMEEDLSILCFDGFDGDNKSNLIVGGSATGTAFVWKLDAQVECIHTIPAKELGRMQFRGVSGTEKFISYVPVRCVKIINLKLLAVGLDDGTINIFDLARETISYSLLAHSSSVQCVTVWNDLLVSCSADEIKTWSLDNFLCIDTIPSQDGKKFHLFIGENGINLVMQKDDVTEVFSLQDFIENFRNCVNKVVTWLW
jgi:WD40 repeat protein